MGNAFLAGQGGGGMSDKKIKEYLNSTVGTDREMPLDALICYLDDVNNNRLTTELTKSGTFNVTVPRWAKQVRVTACGGGGGGFVPSNGGYSSGGGGGDSIINSLYDIPANVSGSTIQVVVGAGGLGASCSQYGGSDYDQKRAATNGGNTVISAFDINMRGGKAPTTYSAGGRPGGPGGGTGGYATSKGSSWYVVDATDGIGGKAGTSLSQYIGGYRRYVGGGGGSLGAGGNAIDSTKDSSGKSAAGTRGGGGGGAADANSALFFAGNGGDGYVKLEWLL